MDNEDIVNYVMDNPDNTNPAVLRGMLNQLNNGGGGGDGLFVVRFLWDTDAGEYVCNRTWEEMVNAYIIDSKPLLFFAGDGICTNYTFNGDNTGLTDVTVWLWAADIETAGMFGQEKITMDSSGAITSSYTSYTLTADS